MQKLFTVMTLLAFIGGLVQVNATNNSGDMENLQMNVMNETTTNGEVGNESPYPFEVCGGAPTDLNVSVLEMAPNPPVKGQNINLGILGNVDEQLTKGSNFEVDVLYKNTEIFSETVNLSKATTLPVGPGPLTLNYSVLIPSVAPPGPYIVKLTFNDQTGTEITCISVAFTL